MEKVAEQRILQKYSKCSCFGVMSTLLKVATIAITDLAMDLSLKKTESNEKTYAISQIQVMFSKEDENIQKFIKGCFKLIYSYAKDDFTNSELYSI